MHTYQFKLLTDAELISGAECVYGARSLESSNYTLDSSRFGATPVDQICQICQQKMEKCIGHYAVIRLPFPIPRVICMKDFKLLLPLVCPICSHLIVPDAKQSLDLPPKARLQYVRKETIKYTNNFQAITICSNCHNRVKTITLKEPKPMQYRFEIQTPGQNMGDQLSPIQLCNILQNYSELEEVGFTKFYHPANFMTYFIPIVPNKLRPKVGTVAAEASVTSYYRQIIIDICPELDSIKRSLNLESNVIISKGQLQNDFNKYYDKLFSYYSLITDIGTQKSRDIEMTMIDKRDRKHADQCVSMLTRLKSKHKKSLWASGIIGSRHDKSTRTVLGGLSEGNTYQIGIPEHVAARLSTYYPVYVQNLDAMKQLVAAMSNPAIKDNMKIMRVLGVYNSQNDYFTSVTQQNAMSKAALLRPGDKLAVSLTDADWVMECRFPVLCEESWGSFEVKRYEGSTLKVHYSDLAKQNGDLDGDEVQAYAMHSHVTDAESILLHSTFAQMIGYKTGDCLIWLGEASKDGIAQVRPNKSISIYNKQSTKPRLITDILESLIPKGITYHDKKTAITDGHFDKDSDKVKLDNHEFIKYVYFTYGAAVAEELLSRLVDLGYDINKDNGNTIGFEVRFLNKENQQRVNEIRDKLYEEVSAIERSADNVDTKTHKQAEAISKAKVEAQKIIKEDNVGSNLEALGLIGKRLEEFTHMIYQIDYTYIKGKRIEPTLAEGTRVSCSFPRHSVDPVAYGYHPGSYTENQTPYEQLLDSKLSRESLYIKGAGVATQGYFSKRLSTACGNNYCNWNRQVTDGFKIVSPQFGSIGASPRNNVVLQLTDIEVDEKEFEQKYNKDKRLIELHKKINANQNRYRRLCNFYKDSNIKNTFATVYHFNQMFKN